MITCVPNYGRDYKTAQEVRAAWEAGKDFRIQDVGCRWNGSAINKEDADHAKETVRIRFNKLTEVEII